MGDHIELEVPARTEYLAMVRAIRAGASGVTSKHGPMADLVSAVKALALGQCWVPTRLLAGIVTEMRLSRPPNVFDQKLEAVHELESQVYEGGANGNEEFVRGVPPASQPQLRKTWLREAWEGRQGSEATHHRNALNKGYGAERGQQVKYAEAFEICEYGRQPTDEEIRTLFPFFGEEQK